MLLTNIVIAGAAVAAGGSLLASRGGESAGAEARRLVDAGAHLVDVRTPDEFMAGHIPGAVNIPLQELEHRLRELEPKGQPVVVYCRSGSRSGSAARLLESAGYRAVFDLGPLNRW
jgi:phage shock protein E